MNPLTALLETELGRRARAHVRETAAGRVDGRRVDLPGPLARPSELTAAALLNAAGAVGDAGQYVAETAAGTLGALSQAGILLNSVLPGANRHAPEKVANAERIVGATFKKDTKCRRDEYEAELRGGRGRGR